MAARFCSSDSGTKLKNWFSLTDPVGPPSALAPLSDRTMIRVLSNSPSSRRNSSSRPMWWSVCSRNPANTSIIRAYRRRSSGEQSAHWATSGSWRDNAASAMNEVALSTRSSVRW
jgi:hypothetical protein